MNSFVIRKEWSRISTPNRFRRPRQRHRTFEWYRNPRDPCLVLLERNCIETRENLRALLPCASTKRASERVARKERTVPEPSVAAVDLTRLVPF